MLQLLEKVFRLPRKHKRFIQVIADATLISLSFLIALMLRLNDWSLLAESTTWHPLMLTLPLSIMVFIKLGFYRAVIRYINGKTSRTLIIGITISSTCLGISSTLLSPDIPYSTPYIYALLSFLTIGGVRFFLRSLHQYRLMRYKTRVVIYGAGAAGSQLVTSLNHGNEYSAIGFIDDWRGMHGTHVEGLKVYSPHDLTFLIKDCGVERILLAIPSATRTRRREILQSLEQLPIPVQTVPGIADVVAGRARINEIRDIAIEDLLGRDPVTARPELMNANIHDKVVMVTGAGGSIGSELCRQILLQCPRQLLLFEACEFSLYHIEHELKRIAAEQGFSFPIKALLGSVQHHARLVDIMRTFSVNTVYHAAAYKHVPMVENNMVDGIQNNVFGTLKAAQAAITCDVETFVLISTDKAVRPTNVMGTTKRLAELICQALACHQQTTRFCMVRFGNVLGSSGSVVPLFRQQIQAGGPLTVTHPEITRYFMTIPEAAQLVIQAGAMGKGSDVFVLDMGEPVKIAELASQMVRLSGLELVTSENPRGDIEIVYTGLRPGEKLYEELLIGSDATQTDHPRIMTANETFWAWPKLNAYLQHLNHALGQHPPEQIRTLLQEAPTAYQPTWPVSDLVWLGADTTATEILDTTSATTTTQAASLRHGAPAPTDMLTLTAASLTKGNSTF